MFLAVSHYAADFQLILLDRNTYLCEHEDMETKLKNKQTNKQTTNINAISRIDNKIPVNMLQNDYLIFCFLDDMFTNKATINLRFI